MKRIVCIATLALSALLTGCTIPHPIAQDYPQYLANNQGESNLPHAQGPASYQLAPATQNHHYEFRAATVGAAHLWIVEFGQILDATLQSQDVQQAFGTLSKDGSAAPVLVFTLQEYRFADYRAYLTLKVDVQDPSGTSSFSKSYQTEGNSQGGKMFFGGPFAMKNATQQSTKAAVDDVLRQFIQDYNQLQLSQR